MTLVGGIQKSPTLFWHDYETSGINPQKDAPVQFAGLRTDYDFNPLEDPIVLYCKPVLDSLPHPDACLITGITPGMAEENGLCEAEFIRHIHEQLARPGTCTLGYNSLRFDDEVTRNCLYRNFYDPYAREWQNGNSRWDIIDVARATRALRPDGIVWPRNNEGRPDFKLEELCKANGISHTAAHDALSDVYATIGLAKLIRYAQPKLYSFLWQHRSKTSVLDLLQLGSFVPVVHVSGRYPAERNCLAIVLPICKHPSNPNGIIVYDLSVDPEPLLLLTATEIKQRIFTATESLPEGVARIPLKTVHINKCPVLAPISVIRRDDELRLEIDLADYCLNIDRIKNAAGLADKLSEVFIQQASEQQALDPDLALYSGGFFADADKHKMALVRAATPIELSSKKYEFNDSRLPEMIFRYRARNFPETLTTEELSRWYDFCRSKLMGLNPGAAITLGHYLARITELKQQNHPKLDMLNALDAYAHKKMQQLNIEADCLNIQ
ncbi:MAG: exodeoxyribonuclease I [Methylococcaceae bacterium]|nr:exodeoxyribonuclease I [Methylococcaceae bacterium]